MNSRAKGKAGELELAKYLREMGYEEAARGQQFRGGGDSPDVIGLPGIHVECKRVEAGNLYVWLDQACRDAAAGRVPVVMHRRNRRPWVAVMLLGDFMAMLEKTRT